MVVLPLSEHKMNLKKLSGDGSGGGKALGGKNSGGRTLFGGDSGDRSTNDGGNDPTVILVA